MEIWIPGALALVGAFGGVVLSNYLTRRTRREDDRRQRLETALRAVLLAIASQHFATKAGMVGKPAAVRDSDVEQFERDLYVGHLKRMFETLRNAREAVAVLVTDGVPVGDSWRGDQEMQEQLEGVHQVLLKALRR